LGRQKAYFVEARQAAGDDVMACEEGVLVYLVDSLQASGRVGADSGTVGQLRSSHERNDMCAGGRHRLLTLHDHAPSSFTDPHGLMTVDLVRESPGDYQVKVSTASPEQPVTGRQR
jgi:hypothetical protein